MSKSKGNTIDPEELINTYGSDTVRLFIIFSASPEQPLEWSDSGLDGAYRFLRRIWALAYHHQSGILEQNTISSTPMIDWQQLSKHQKDIRQQMYALLQQANYDMKRKQFNTVASACMKLLNLLSDLNEDDTLMIQEGLSILLRLLNPISPHITTYLWKELGYGDDINTVSWPIAIDIPKELLNITLAIQVNGKLRGQLIVPKDTDQKVIEQMAFSQESIQKYITNKKIKKIIVIPNRIVNIVIE